MGTIEMAIGRLSHEERPGGRVSFASVQRFYKVTRTLSTMWWYDWVPHVQPCSQDPVSASTNGSKACVYLLNEDDELHSWFSLMKNASNVDTQKIRQQAGSGTQSDSDLPCECRRARAAGKGVPARCSLKTRTCKYGIP